MKKIYIAGPIFTKADSDSGTAWEIGFAYSKNLPIIGFLEDTRKPHINLLNPMIVNSIKKIARNKILSG